MTSAWEGTRPVASLAQTEGLVTLIEGQTFCLSGRTGDMHPEFPHGLFVLDTRVLSCWEWQVDGCAVEPLAVAVPQPFAAQLVGRAHPPAGRADAEVVIERRRDIGRGLRERVRVVNYGLEHADIELSLRCEADFADLFEVKESRVRRHVAEFQEVRADQLCFRHRGEGLDKDVTVAFSRAAETEPGLARWRIRLAPKQAWDLCVDVSIHLAGTRVVPRFACDADGEESIPGTRLERWRARLPVLRTDHVGLLRAVGRAGEDLGTLRIYDPEHPDLPIVAAGAPWFMTVFGRDSLLAGWMTLLADPQLARGVVETLARFQGTDRNDDTEEEPGKILHEMRFGGAPGLSLGGGDVYYGSVDATPLFVMLVGELRRWGLADELVDRLLPHVDRALDWIEQFGDRDGDGYVEYQRRNPRGLVNQGWKDSWDAIRFADGRLADAPIALCEVQAYAYAAYVARAHFAWEVGDEPTCRRYQDKAAALRAAFNRDFWLEERGGFALGLDADKRPIDALASNMGHCLWAGIVEPDRSAAVADHLMSDALFSGWGVRTLGTSMAAYNPVSYHNGSVWPHDNALCAAGLMRYGHVQAAHRIIEAQLAMAEHQPGYRLPELFGGFGRPAFPVPVSYPTSCSPQAWASAAPLSWLRTLLRLDPSVPHEQLWVSPALPPSVRRLRVDGIQVAGHSVGVTVEGDDVIVTGTGALQLNRAPRRPLTEAAPAPGDGLGAR